MKINADYHTHTHYSDGTSTIEENVIEAIKKGLDIIAITDHGPDHFFYGIKKKDILKQKEEILRLREKYKNIRILHGIEANILCEDGRIDTTDLDYKFDIVIAGYHFGSTPKKFFDLITHLLNILNRNFGFFKTIAKKRNTKAIINAIKRNKIFILTHPGDKGPIDTLEVAKACKENNVLLEINERHTHLNLEQLELIKKLDLKYVISSDAHKKEHVGKVNDCFKRVKEAKIDLSSIVNIKRENED